MGPSVLTKFALNTCTGVPFLRANLQLCECYWCALQFSWLSDKLMIFWQIWVFLVSWKNDKYNFIWSYLGGISVALLLSLKLNIYISSVFLFIWEFLRVTLFYLFLRLE